MFIHILFELKNIFEQKQPAVIHRQRFFPHIFEFCQQVLTLCYKPFAICHKLNMSACRRHITRSWIMIKSALFVPVLLVVACDNPSRVPAPAAATDDSNDFTVTLPDGTEVSGEDAYNAAIVPQVGPIETMKPMALTVTTGKADGGVKGLTFGKFHVSIQVDSTYLAGCINKSFLHLKVMVENDSMPANMIELHLLAWFENSKPCFAVMNTGFIGYGWCYKMCVSNTKDGLKLGIKNGLISAGVSGTIATIIAAVVAPVSEVALAM